MIDEQSDEASHKIIAIACRGGRVFQRPAVFLKAHSGFFAAFLRHDTSKASEIPHVVFRDHYFAEEETLEHVLRWMHTGDIKAAKTGDDHTENGDGKYWLHDWKALVDIWLLADYLIIPRLQNYITMVLIRRASTAKLPYELMNYIWAHQNSDISKLCRLFERLVDSKPCEVVEDNLLKLSPQVLINLATASAQYLKEIRAAAYKVMIEGIEGIEGGPWPTWKTSESAIEALGSICQIEIDSLDFKVPEC
ncbi:putative BTB domain-containing protein [Seiridium cardinale]|uniref:BTB domain-containing protein n=1 Tax=Seiridium cardinale TaxID=138064 RepID=A0ABR2XLK7_9PEZI